MKKLITLPYFSRNLVAFSSTQEPWLLCCHENNSSCVTYLITQQNIVICKSDVKRLSLTYLYINCLINIRDPFKPNIFHLECNISQDSFDRVTLNMRFYVSKALCLISIVSWSRLYLLKHIKIVMTWCSAVSKKVKCQSGKFVKCVLQRWYLLGTHINIMVKISMSIGKFVKSVLSLDIYLFILNVGFV